MAPLCRPPAFAEPTERPLTGPSWEVGRGALQVHPGGRFLVHADGSPFLWLADTAWELFHRCTREEVELYLEKRRAQGFTVIQAVALAELDGVREPNVYGHLPLVDEDPSRPALASDGGADYWKHVDFVIERARDKGLYLALLPTWGDKVGPAAWGKGPEIFTVENARAYGRFLGERYREAPNLIWVNGGDRPLFWEGRDFRPIWRALAEGLREGDGGRHLITFHPVGNTSSSAHLHDEPWLDFNLLQTGHSRFDDANHDMVAADYGRLPAKPVIDGEPRYENHPVGWDPQVGWFDDVDVRRAAYWAVFAGACGHTYGCHDVWQFLTAGRRPVSAARTGWREAIDFAGAWDLMHLRALLLSRPFLERIPDPSLIAAGQGVGGDHVGATRDVAGSYAMIYVPSGRPVSVDVRRLPGATRYRAWWFDPRTGSSAAADEWTFVWKEFHRAFTPPGSPGRGNDWVLVIDDATKGYPAPGSRRL